MERELQMKHHTFDEIQAKAYKLDSLWKEFIALLETTEESDSGRIFRPNYIGSCRTLDADRMNQIIKEAKELKF